MKAYVNIAVVGRDFNGGDRTDSWLLTGEPEAVAERVKQSVLSALKEGRTKQIVLNPIHPANVQVVSS